MNNNTFKTCIDKSLQCAAMCNYCASACLKEDNVEMMTTCIQLDMECALICSSAAQLMSLGSQRSKEICKVCAEMCKDCGEECSKHKNDHCRECARICLECADECRKMAA